MEVIAHDLSHLPPSLINLLKRMRDMDRSSKSEWDRLKEEENELIKEIEEFIKAGNKDFDEKFYQDRFKDIQQRRSELSKTLDSQVELAQVTYNFLDKKINYFGKPNYALLHQNMSLTLTS
jgi:hypothetical protein